MARSTSPLGLEGRAMTPSMTVQYDAQLLAWQVRGGISNYFANMVAEFERDPVYGVAPTGVPQYTQNPQAIELGMGRPLPRGVPQRVRAIRALNAPGQFVAGLRRPHVMHHTYYANERLRGSRGVTRVVTVYDMIPELFPELYPAGNPHLHKFAHVRSADLVLCISETTREDLLNMVPAVEDRVRVTPLGVSEEYLAQAGTGSTASGRAHPFVLFVGMRDHYKNFDVVLRAMSRVSADVDLVVAGGGPLKPHELERVKELGLITRVTQLTPSDTDLRGLYRSATAFVFPSRYEGFGLPVIEAMASGCPAVLASTAIFSEIASDAALYFEPEDDAALAESIDALRRDAQSRSELIERGRARAASYTWANTAALTARAYREAANV